MDKKIILASASPRRSEILKHAGLSFIVSPADCDEKLDTDVFDYKLIEQIAYKKAKCIFNKISEPCFIIGADTVVVHDGRILCKPHDFESAFTMLNSLSNDEHFVVTSICIINSETSEIKQTSVTSYVVFNELTDEMINSYIKSFKPFDKAGAYGIQELPKGFLKQLKGDKENVIGISSKAVIELLNSFR